MSAFIPHMAISTEHPRLELPMDFRPDDIDILVNATPEERAVIVNTGCVALRALKNKKDQLSEGEAFKKGQEKGVAAENVKWQQEKKNIVNDYEANITDLKEKLLILQNEINRQTTVNVSAETRRAKAEADANEIRALEQEKINRTRAEVESEMSHKLNNLTEELNTKKAEADKAASDLREAQQKFYQEMEKKSFEFHDKLNAELHKKSAERDKQINDITLTKENEIGRLTKIIESFPSKFESANLRLTEELKNERDTSQKALLDLLKAAQDAKKAEEDKFAEIRAAEQKVRDELNSKIHELREQLDNLTHRRANSSIKGKDNEDAFAKLLDLSFGSDQRYRKLPKATESGDHVIEWKGIKLMFENKKYEDTVPKKEVDKALRDFKSNKDCDVLIFVSEDSNIINHICPFDITPTEDGRPAIWIGEFSHNGNNKVVHLQLVGQVAEELVRLHRREKLFENGEKIVDYKKKVNDLIKSFNETKIDIDNLLKLQKTCQRGWKDLMEAIDLLIVRFKRRQDDANRNEDEVKRENGAEVDVDSEPKPKKSKKVQAKNNTAKNGKADIRSFCTKSPQVASGHQPQQEASNGFCADEIGENQAKQQFSSEEPVIID